MRSGIKTGSGGSFSAIQNELIVSDADTGNGVNLTAFSNQTSQGEGGGAQPGYPNDHHSDEHSNPIADSLSFSGTESHYQIFTGKRISLASQHTSLLFIVCLPESAHLTWIRPPCLYVCLRFRNGLRIRPARQR